MRITRKRKDLRQAAVWILLASLSAASLRSPVRADFQSSTHLMPFDEDTIAYSKTPARDPVTLLQERIDKGEVALAYDPKFGYLPALLKELRAPTSSQMLVFSKTSFQRERISPKSPRAIFFGDDAYVGYVPNSPMLEISAADPRLGGVFYTLEQKKVERPRLVRNDQCLECHASAKTMGVPGHLVRSFETDDNGVVNLSSGTSQVNHRTPLAERWGGWYVTGGSGDQTHRGNLIGAEDFEAQRKDPSHKANLTQLHSFFDLSQHLSGQSDIVALMVLEHQTHMHNFLTRLHYAATLALQQYGHVNYLKSETAAFLKYLLFTEETPLKDKITGTSSFARDFAAQGPRDSAGRSLRDFDLQSRLFKYPCSYLIYSEAFDALPKPFQERIYQRLHDILTGKDNSPEFASLSPALKQDILTILRETKKGLPEYWGGPETATDTNR